MKKSNGRSELAISLISVVITLFVMIMAVVAMSGIKKDSSEQGMEQLEKSIRRAATACYAQEGIYPPSLDYLKEHYGIQINEDRYEVHYSVFGENLAPDITIIERNG